MPELPEVESTRLSLLAHLPGATVHDARLGKPLRWPLGIPPHRLSGLQLDLPARRGKYLWVPLRADPSAPVRGGLLIHLGMSGSLTWIPVNQTLPAAGPHVHFELLTDRGVLRLTDPRRFGAVVWSASMQVEPAASLLARLGVEPLEAGFDGQTLRQGFAGRRTSVKEVLLSGSVVVGAGNIYVSEALFRAGIDPRTPAHSLGTRRCQRLADALRNVLSQALHLGGTTLRDFRNAHGHAGQFQEVAQMYDREGEPCPRCTRPIRRIVQGQRATYFCSHCQRR